MSSESTVGWVSDPNGRGTAGLVTSCILTLGLCAWSALHLNIPPKGETQRQYWSRNLRWVLLGVFIPELVILAAWRQWASCRELELELYHILQAEKEKDPSGGLEPSKSTSGSTFENKVCEQKPDTCVQRGLYNIVYRRAPRSACRSVAQFDNTIGRLCIVSMHRWAALCSTSITRARTLGPLLCH